MSKYRMDDGSVIDTDKATAHWNEATEFDGCSRISKATGSQWNHQTLYPAAPRMGQHNPQVSGPDSPQCLHGHPGRP